MKSSKKLLSALLAVVMLLGLIPGALAAEPRDGQADHVVINQVYGSKGTDNVFLSHNFIELYNPTAQDVALDGWSVQYRSSADGNASDGWTVLALSGTIRAKGFYLIRCAATGTSEATAYQVPEGDLEWAQFIHNKGFSVALMQSTTQLGNEENPSTSGPEGAPSADLVDLAAAAGNDYKASDGYAKSTQLPFAAEGNLTGKDGIQSKQNAIRRIWKDGAPVDTNDNSADFEAVSYKNYSAGSVPTDKLPQAGNSASQGGGQPDTSIEPAFGFENGSAALDMALLGRYDAGMTNADGGVMEIVAYNTKTGWAYSVNGNTGKLAAFSLDPLADAGEPVQLEGSEIDVQALVEAAGVTYGDMTSVAISPDGGTLAAAVQSADYSEEGCVAFFTCNGDGSLTFLRAVETGVQPDMVTFTPDGSKVLTANEGEPREGYGAGTVDPQGSVTIIDTATFDARNATFDSYDATRDALAGAGIVLKKDTAPSVDLEPEYIACTDTTAYVSLQEANAIAVLDLASGRFTGIYSVGFADYGKVPVDIDKKDEAYAPQTYAGLKGIRMPDGIALYTVDGVDYLLTANEGDSRDWTGYCNEVEINFKDADAQSPAGNITAENTGLTGKVVFFDASGYDGLEAGTDYLFGGRSFTLLRVTDSGLEEVFDSGSDFERLSNKYLPGYFNCSNDDLAVDDRSGKKGPEPETVVTGAVDGRTYAFVTLERIGGIMVYDITDPADISFVNYVNSRDFTADVGADDSPEGLCFIPAAGSPTGGALLLAACEVGGTVAAYALTGADYTPSLNLAVISDDHLYSTTLGNSGAAFEQYLASDRKMLAESEKILDQALENIAASGADYLLIPGDLTKDGEKVNHELLAEKLRAFELRTGIEVFVINGNHDISNAHAVSFNGDAQTRVETINSDEFRSIYADFGYAQAVAADDASLSYAVDLGDDYRLIVMDACIYNDDKENPEQKTGGAFRDETWNWVLAQIQAAVKAGKRPIGMMHHGLVPHTGIQPTMFSEYLVKDYTSKAAALADAGMNLVFTGHFHAQDVASYTSEKGNTLYDVETGSLVTSPSPIRYVTLDGATVRYTTENIQAVNGLDLKGAADFQTYAHQFLVSGLEGLVESMLPAVLMQLDPTMTPEQAAAAAAALAATALTPDGSVTVKSLLASAFAAHYAGDETMDAVTGQVVAALGQSSDAAQQLLASVTSSLYTDFAPADRVASFTLDALPSYPTYVPTPGTTDDTKPGEALPFQDVAEDAWYYDAVRYVYEHGLFTGTTETIFSPGTGMTRAMLVTVLYRLSGTPAVTGGTAFTDVAADSYYADAVRWASANDLVRGYGNGMFGPNDSVSREQMTVILYRYAAYRQCDVSARADVSGFADAGTISSWAEEAVSWATAASLLEGKDGNRLDPLGGATRAQVATVLARLCENILQ